MKNQIHSITNNPQSLESWGDEQGQIVPEVEAWFFWQGFHAIMSRLLRREVIPLAKGAIETHRAL